MDDFPVEILSKIYQYARDWVPSRYGEVYTIQWMRANRRLYNIAKPVLYSAVEIRQPGKYLLPLAYAFFKDDQKASWVRSLELRRIFPYTPISDRSSYTWPLVAYLNSVLNAKAEFLLSTHPDAVDPSQRRFADLATVRLELLKALKSDPGLTFALLALSFPNLRHLQFEGLGFTLDSSPHGRLLLRHAISTGTA